VEGDGWKGMEGEWSRQPCQLHNWILYRCYEIWIYAMVG